MIRNGMTYARAAGALYLTTHVTSVTAVVAYAAGATALGVMLEFALALGCLGTGLLLWLLLREAGPARAATFALLRGLEASVILTGTLPMLAMMWGAAPSEVATGLHTAAFLIGQGLVISINTLVLGWLLLTSGGVPRALAVLGLIGGAAVLAGNLAQLFALIPIGGTVAGICAMPVFAFEIWFAVQLILRGIREPARPSVRGGRAPARR